MKTKKYAHRHKVRLCFDENFPSTIISDLKKVKSIRRKLSINTVSDIARKGIKDKELFSLCKKFGLVLVTFDVEFWNDKVYPSHNFPGMIVLNTSNKNNSQDTNHSFMMFVRFLNILDYPMVLLSNKKFKINLGGFTAKGVTVKGGLGVVNILVREAYESILDKIVSTFYS